MANRSHSAEEKAMLINMADTWDSLAIDRESHIARQKRLAALEGRTAKRIWRAPFRSINSTLRTMSERRRFRPVGSNANIRWEWLGVQLRARAPRHRRRSVTQKVVGEKG
jgi:hypothetical protein